MSSPRLFPRLQCPKIDLTMERREEKRREETCGCERYKKMREGIKNNVKLTERPDILL